MIALRLFTRADYPVRRKALIKAARYVDAMPVVQAVLQYHPTAMTPVILTNLLLLLPQVRRSRMPDA